MSTTLKPRYDPLLWAQLRPSAISARKAGGEDASQTLSFGNVPLVPENRIATSLRVVLHDTKSVMEQFSDRLETLLGSVDRTRSQIDKVNDKFESGHDKILEELVATVNRHQKGLLEVIDTPAQASALDQIKLLQTETLKILERLESKANFFQQNLLTISEQQGHILTCLTGLTPLASSLQDISQLLHNIISQLSTLQPLCQTLPDQLKVVQREISTQNIHAINNAFSTGFPTFMEKHFESLGRIVSDSTKLITTALAQGSCNGVLQQITGTEDFSGNAPSTHTTASVSKSKKGLKRSRQDTNHSQSAQGEADMNILGGPDVPTSCLQDPKKKSCKKQGYKRPRLAKTRANALEKPTNLKLAKASQAEGLPKTPTLLAPNDTRSTTENELNSESADPMPLTIKSLTSSARVLRPRHLRGSRPTTITQAETNDRTALIPSELVNSAIPNDKFLVPPPPSIQRFPSVIPTPISGRRTLIPPSIDSDQHIDIELDWGDMTQI